MAVKGEIIFKDAEGNEMEGPRSNKSSIVLEFFQRIKLPTDVQTGQVTGSRIYDPFEITKEIDRPTPFMFQYCAEGKLFNLLKYLCMR